MAEISGFFNSVNNDRVYDATDVARFLKKFFTNGVFNNSLQVVANDNMTVSVSVGQANIEGYSYELDAIKTLDIDDADSTLSRIDSVILRLDLSNRQITAQILKGSTATDPSQPSIVRSGNIYDLRLANILVSTGVTRITTSEITDTRLTSDCGNVVQAVLSLNTNDIFKQYETWFKKWFEELQEELSGDIAGNLQTEIDNLRITLGIAMDTYDSTETYDVGNMVVKDHKIYECNTNGTTGAWNISKWDLVPIII